MRLEMWKNMKNAMKNTRAINPLWSNRFVLTDWFVDPI
jgi:hypothetical protein